MIKNICFVNNYNNEKFIAECLTSVFSQTTTFDQVLVVDDGSTDGSIDIISDFLTKHSNLTLHRKVNEGQISTFNSALSYLPDSAQIFLLDGDDIYPPDYLQMTCGLLGSEGWDYAFCEKYAFTGEEFRMINTSRMRDLPNKLIHSSSALVRSRKCWIGNVTSTLSISARLFKKIFPYPGYLDKPLFVDDLINYSSSILGARKVHIPSLSIGWRSHDMNISKRAYTPEDVINRDLAIERLVLWYCGQNMVARYPGIIEFFGEYRDLGLVWQKKLDLPGKYRMLNRLLRDSTRQFLSEI